MKPRAGQDSTALRAPEIVCPAGSFRDSVFEAQLLATPDSQSGDFSKFWSAPSVRMPLRR